MSTVRPGTVKADWNRSHDRLSHQIYLPPKFTGGGYDAETEAMLYEARGVLREIQLEKEGKKPDAKVR